MRRFTVVDVGVVVSGAIVGVRVVGVDIGGVTFFDERRGFTSAAEKIAGSGTRIGAGVFAASSVSCAFRLPSIARVVTSSPKRGSIIIQRPPRSCSRRAVVVNGQFATACGDANDDDDDDDDAAGSEKDDQEDEDGEKDGQEDEDAEQDGQEKAGAGVEGIASSLRRFAAAAAVVVVFAFVGAR